jgi:hypothetical protein
MGGERAPPALRQCVSDLNVYREETVSVCIRCNFVVTHKLNKQRIEKLLVEDYSRFNGTLITALDQMGSVIVERLKQVSGAAALDTLSDISTSLFIFISTTIMIIY